MILRLRGALDKECQCKELGIQKITVFVFVRRVFEVLLLAVAKQLPFGNVKPSSSSNEPTWSTSALGKAIL